MEIAARDAHVGVASRVANLGQRPPVGERVAKERVAAGGIVSASDLVASSVRSDEPKQTPDAWVVVHRDVQIAACDADVGVASGVSDLSEGSPARQRV
jgi:hypothetical protein